MPRYRVTDPDSGNTLTLEGDSPPTEQELTQVFAEYNKRTGVPRNKEIGEGQKLEPNGPDLPGAAQWMAKQSPLKGASQEIGKLPGKFLETLGTLAEVAGPTIESAIGDPGAVPKTPRTAAQVIRDVGQNPLVRIGRKSQQEAIAQVPISPEEESSFTTKMGRGAGSMLPYVVAGPAAPALIGLESFSDHLTTDFDNAKSKGKSEDDAAKEAFTKALASGGLQATIFALLPKPLRKLGDKWLIERYGYDTIKRFLAGRVANIGEGTVLGAASRISENAVEGENLGKDVLDSAAGMGALLGVSPRGMTPAEAKARGESQFNKSFPPAAPGQEPPQIPNAPVPVEPGPLGAIPEGGTTPVRTRIRLTLDRGGVPIPATKGVSDQTQIQRPKEEVIQAGAVPPVQGVAPQVEPAVKTETGVAQRQSEDQKAAQLNVPAAEELSALPQSEFSDWFFGLKENRLAAQKQTAETTSPFKLRQYATDAANEFVRLRNSGTAKTKGGGTLTEPEMNEISGASYKMQYFNEALREAGEQPVEAPMAALESQVGTKKKPSGGRTSGMTPKEVGLIKTQEKLENDWSVATRTGKVNLNADELKTGDVVIVRGEPLSVASIDPDDGTVTLKSAKGGRWGERTLQAGQQIGVDEYKPSAQEDFFGAEKTEPPKIILPTEQSRKGKAREGDINKLLEETGVKLPMDPGQIGPDEFQKWLESLPQRERKRVYSGDKGVSRAWSFMGLHERAIATAIQKGLKVPQENRKLVEAREAQWDDLDRKEKIREKLLADIEAKKPVSAADVTELGAGRPLVEDFEDFLQLSKYERKGDQWVSKETTTPIAKAEPKETLAELKARAEKIVFADKRAKFESQESGVSLVQLKNGKWTYGARFTNGREGFGFSLGIDEPALQFDTRQQALDDALTQIIGAAQKAEKNEQANEKEIEQATKVKEWAIPLLSQETRDAAYRRGGQEPPKSESQPELPVEQTPEPKPEPQAGPQKYRIKETGPQLYTMVERLKQTDAERESGEQPVKVRNDSTGKEEVVLEAQLQAVKERTAEEKEKSKPLTKRELDDALRKFGMDPSEFSNSGQKRAALKRARAKAREASFTDTQRTAESSLGEFSTPDQIRRSLWNTKRISEPHRKALDWILRTGIMDRLPGLRMEIVDYIRGGAVGEYTRDNRVARFLSWTDSDVPIHEFFHDVWGYLQPEDRKFISDLRKATIAEKAPQTGDTFTDGITSDEFVERGFSRDLYHLSSDGEFFTWLMTEKAVADMKQPEAATFVKKVRAIIRDLWNGLKDALGFNSYQDVLWRQLMSGKYEFTKEDGVLQAAYEKGRDLALVRSRRDAADQTMNYDDMSDTQKRDMGSDIELQNTFVEPLATRLVTGRSRGIVSKLQKVFGDRLAALAEIRGRGDRHDVNSYDALMANPSIDPETKQIIVGDMEKNVRDFRDTAERTIMLADSKIQGYQQKIVKLTEDLDVQKARRDVLTKAARKIVSDYQNRYLARIRQGGQAGEATVSAEVMRQLQQLRQSPEIISRIIDQIATTVPEDVLTRPGLAAPELLQALIQANGGNMETLSAAMGEAQRGVSREMLQVAIGIMQASDQLAENVLAIRPTINPEDVRAIESLAAELRQAASTGARGDMRQLVREVGGTAQTLSMVRGAIGRLSPRIRRAARQLSEWTDTQEILDQARNDPDLKAMEKKVYDHFDVRKVVVTQGGDHEFTMRNPLTNEEVKILTGLDKLTTQSNYAKLQALFNDAAAYLANPADPNYDPRLAAAWKYMIENTQQFWLNPSVNVFMPHMTPYRFDLPAFLSDPFKILRTTAGLESNASQVKLSAMSKIKKSLMDWDRKSGNTVDVANKKAARAANLTLEEWYTKVFAEIAFRNQYLGQIVPRAGDLLLSGHKVTAEDLAAVKTNHNYLKRVRDLAENSPGFTAANINPARVVESGISRRAEPTGPMTLPSRRASRALQWGMEWRRMQDENARLAWLNDPERFNRIVVGHMDTYNTPGYAVPSRWKDQYKGIVTDIKAENGPESIQEIAEILYDSQDLDEAGNAALTREQIQSQIIGEINKGFDNFEVEGRGDKEKPPTLVEAFSAENSFTKPRSPKIGSPFTFYDYGVRDYPGRLRMGNDAYSWYALDFVESLRRLHSALTQRIAALTEGLSPKEQAKVHKVTKSAQLRGDEFFDLAELKLNANRIATLLGQQTRVIESSRKARSSLESTFYRTQSAVGAYILMTPGARSTHTFGMMGVSGVFNAMVENAVVKPNAKAWGRLVAATVKDVLKAPVSIPGLKVTNEQLRLWNGIVQPYAEMVIRRREQMERLKELSTIPESDVRGSWNSMTEDFQNVFRKDDQQTLASRIIKFGAGLSDLHNAFWLAWSPQRYNDWILNSSTREVRQDIVRGLQESALKHVRNRSDVLGTGYTDFSRPENVLSPQELTGKKGASAEREAFEKRRLFKVLGMDLDEIMVRYFRRMDQATANGENTNEIAFLTPAEENSLDFEIAQGMGLSSPGTRNLAAQGSLLRRATGYIHGLPLSTMGKFLSMTNRLSNHPTGQYALALLPAVLMAGTYTTLMGLMRIQSTTALNRLFFNQSSALPTIGQAKTADDWWRLLLRAQAGWWPGIGDIIMSTVLRTPDRFGHLDSMFVMWNFIQDVINMSGDMWHTKDVVGPLTKFGERWLPPIKVITRRMSSQAGVRDHYNAVADIQASLPPSMETAAAKFRGGLRPTETTPLTYRALNAMYNGDWDEFNKIAQQYAAKKAEQGVKDGELAFKHSISAHNPWIERLGKLPTDDEREKILSRMDDTQKAEVKKAEDTFRQFGERYGTRVAFTAEQSEAQKGASGGGGNPLAGVGSAKLPGVSGSGNVNVPRGTLPAGLRRISIAGRARSPFIGVGTRRATTTPRRVSLGAPQAARRLVSGRLKVTGRGSRRGRRGVGRRRRISLKV